jgi:hypothetical protein
LEEWGWSVVVVVVVVVVVKCSELHKNRDEILMLVKRRKGCDRVGREYKNNDIIIKTILV